MVIVHLLGGHLALPCVALILLLGNQRMSACLGGNSLSNGRCKVELWTGVAYLLACCD